LLQEFNSSINKSPAVAEMAAQCCTSWTVGHSGQQIDEKHVSAVMNHIIPKTRLFLLHFCRRNCESSGS